jgi:hypothetical protein
MLSSYASSINEATHPPNGSKLAFPSHTAMDQSGMGISRESDPDSVMGIAFMGRGDLNKVGDLTQQKF